MGWSPFFAFGTVREQFGMIIRLFLWDKTLDKIHWIFGSPTFANSQYGFYGFFCCSTWWKRRENRPQNTSPIIPDSARFRRVCWDCHGIIWSLWFPKLQKKNKISSKKWKIIGECEMLFTIDGDWRTTVVSNRSMDPVYSFGAKSTYKSAVHDNPKKPSRNKWLWVYQKYRIANPHFMVSFFCYSDS